MSTIVYDKREIIKKLRKKRYFNNIEYTINNQIWVCVREANKCAYWLAKWGCSMQEDFAIFDFPFTADLETLLAKDTNGLYYCRLAAASMASVAV